MAHGDIAVVPAEEHLIALGEHAAVFIQPGVDGGLAAAGADGLYLGYRVGKLHQTPRAGEKVREKIRPQAEAQHGDVLLIDDAAQLVDLLRREKLRLVRDDDIGMAGSFGHLAQRRTLFQFVHNTCAGIVVYGYAVAQTALQTFQRGDGL